MKKQGLRLSPHAVNKNQWWYEDRAGLCMVHWCPHCGKTTVLKTIPWKAVRNALRRKDGEKS